MSKPKKSEKDKKKTKPADAKPLDKSPVPKDHSAAFSLDGPYPYEDQLKTRPYEEMIQALQIELLHAQKWIKDEGQKVVVLFEGRDAAGKGGTIKRFTEHLNPRGARVVALSAPTEHERGQWYFQRYVANLPTRGEIVLFDRSWYNRAGVEPVMGFCTPNDYQQFIHQVPAFERALIESGIWFFKLWFDVSRHEQKRRIESRQTDPLKQWKLSPMDYESIKRWDDYTKARDGMFLYTNTPQAPWTVIRSNDKKRARIGTILTVLNRLPYPDKNPQVVVAPDPLIVGSVDNLASLAGRFMFADPK